MKTYKCGFYGGKFLPFHKGHKYCIEVAAAQCDRVVVIFFKNSEEEEEILKGKVIFDRNILAVESREESIRNECKKYDNVEFITLDCKEMHKKAKELGIGLWDAETDYVMEAVGDFQAVYSSEPSYDSYFRRAYPFAKHILVDVPREHVPISGTKIRDMTKEEGINWL